MRPPRQFLCVDCEHVWKTEFGALPPETCPRCGSPCFGRLTWSPGDGPGGWQGRGARRSGRPARFLDTVGVCGVARHEGHAVG